VNVTPDPVAVLEALEQRGTLAWVVADPPVAATAVVLDVSGLDSGLRALVGRGFVVTADELPERLVLSHPTAGAVTLLPVGFTTSGAARWYRHDGSSIELPATHFDPAALVPRLVRLGDAVHLLLGHPGPGEPDGPALVGP
jgi:hypothetical protein